MSMVSSVKLFKVLEKLCVDGSAKASVLSRELDLNKSSVHRFLNTLIDLGYISRDAESGYYTAGLKVYEMGVHVKNRLGIARIAAPILRRLQVEVNEAVNLGVLHNNEMLTLERFTPDDSSVKIVVKAKLPAYCTALGKVLLASLDNDRIAQYLAEVELRPFTSRTLTDPDKIKEMIADVRLQEIAMDDRELDENIRSIAMPIRDENGMVVAGISVTAAASRLEGDRLASAKTKLIEAAKEVCCSFGHQQEQVLTE